MGVDRTQIAIEILRYFYDHSDRDQGVTISEIRKRILPRKENSRVWLRSKLGLDLVKDVISIYLNLDYIEKDRPIIMKDKSFDSYRITQNGREVVEEYSKAKHLRDLFSAILYMEALKPR